jgi:hypothetical protein
MYTYGRVRARVSYRYQLSPARGTRITIATVAVEVRRFMYAYVSVSTPGARLDRRV